MSNRFGGINITKHYLSVVYKRSFVPKYHKNCYGRLRKVFCMCCSGKEASSDIWFEETSRQVESLDVDGQSFTSSLPVSSYRCLKVEVARIIGFLRSKWACHEEKWAWPAKPKLIPRT